ncbi:hypothetical protein [Rhodocaloribacter sp.]
MQIMTEWTPIAVLLGDGDPERTARPVPEETDTLLDGLFLAFAKARVTLTDLKPSPDASSPTS